MRWCATQNGFELAELDLQQRGPGEFFGTRQAGLPEFRVANLLRDRALLELAKVEAARFAEKPDPAISREETDAVWARLKQQWQRTVWAGGGLRSGTIVWAWVEARRAADLHKPEHCPTMPLR